MKKFLLCLCMLVSPPSIADLYKCTTAGKTAYQDKPCQTAQTQQVIKQQPYQPRVQTVVVTLNSARIERDERGRIKRSAKAKADFKVTHPCPANGKRSGACPGYVIDHIKALACGGADSPDNMQWQTIAAGKEKDRWERNGCTVQKLD